MEAPPERASSVLPSVLKISSPATGGFWEIPILFKDDHLLALDKPAGLLTCPDRYDPERPNLMRLLHRAIAQGSGWARAHDLSYVANVHRLDFETSGVLLLARSKGVLTRLADQFGAEKPVKTYFALAQGAPEADAFTVDAPIAPHPARPGLMRIQPKGGKRSRTDFKVLTRFLGYTWLECRPLTGRTHQIRVHLKWVKCPIVGDRTYGGEPLRLSQLKSGFKRRRNEEERPLLRRVGLHAAKLALPHPVTGEPIHIESPLPKDLRLALRYLHRFAMPAHESWHASASNR
jgi:RluA family pseudouridine synthase